MKYLALIFGILAGIAIIYGVITTSMIIVKDKEIKTYTRTIDNITDEIIKKNDIILAKQEMLNKLESARTINDFVKIWKELQSEK